MTLTKRQKEVLNYLVAFMNKNGYSPSFEEIARALKLTSLATVHKHLSTLEKKNYIRRGYNQSRSIEVVQLPKPVREQVLDRHIIELPLAGRIAAGSPLEAVEDKETISLADFARGQNTFVLQVKGESMREDHILDGDFIVVEQTQVANPGEIVVALVGEDEATVKRFYREPGGKIRLQPANSQMSPILVAATDVRIQGRVVGVLRKYYLLCSNNSARFSGSRSVFSSSEFSSNLELALRTQLLQFGLPFFACGTTFGTPSHSTFSETRPKEGKCGEIKKRRLRQRLRSRSSPSLRHYPQHQLPGR
jgi:repressor LexA